MPPLRFLEGVARGRRVIAVGRLGEEVTGAPYVAHPSHGGAAAAFRGGARMLCYHSAPARRPCAAFYAYDAEDLEREAGRGRSPLVPGRRRGADARPSRHAIADTLRGKGKPEYTPHVDTGDFVVVVNAEKIQVTGNKLDQKMYYRHRATRAACAAGRSASSSTAGRPR